MARGSCPRIETRKSLSGLEEGDRNRVVFRNFLTFLSNSETSSSRRLLAIRRYKASTSSSSSEEMNRRAARFLGFQSNNSSSESSLAINFSNRDFLAAAFWFSISSSDSSKGLYFLSKLRQASPVT